MSKTSPLLAALNELGPHEHACSIYATSQEQFEVAVPFIHAGLERGEQCIYIVDRGRNRLVRDAMGAGGIDVERAVGSPALIVRNAERAY